MIYSTLLNIVLKKSKSKDLLFSWRHHPDLNWGIKLLQSSALPLGYGAVFYLQRMLL